MYCIIFFFLSVVYIFSSIIVFSLFLYSKHPFYFVMLIGSAALILSCDRASGGYGVPVDLWILAAAPIYLIISITLALLLKSNLELGRRKSKIELSCGFAISNALGIYVIFACETPSAKMLFFINYVACIGQIAIFLACYAATQHRNIENHYKLKHDQFSLLMTIFLASASYSAYSGGYTDRNLSAVTNYFLTYYNHYTLVAYGFYILWALCVWHFSRKLYHLVKAAE